jgi:cytochrome bd-type quinol oxidase subunit 2
MTHVAPSRPQPPGSGPHLSMGSVLAALALGTAIGSGLTGLLFASDALFSPSGGGFVMAVSMLPLTVAFACPIWLAGLTALGGPCWWVLHRLGVRSRWAAALAGALLTLLVAGGYLVLSPVSADRESASAWMFVAGLTAIGAVTGRVLAKVAYPKRNGR